LSKNLHNEYRRTHSHKQLSQLTKLCKGDMSQHSKTDFT